MSKAELKITVRLKEYCGGHDAADALETGMMFNIINVMHELGYEDIEEKDVSVNLQVKEKKP
jgi:hypothetical protein